MRIGIFGSREVLDDTKIKQAFELLEVKLHFNAGTVFLHGGAKGAQEMFIDLVKFKHFQTVLFRPWSLIDRKLKVFNNIFFYRNLQILENSDLVLVFTTGKPDLEVDKVLEYCEQNGEIDVIKVSI